MHANRNREAMKKVEKGMMKANHTRNLFAVFAIVLTTFMITTVFSLGINYMENMELMQVRVDTDKCLVLLKGEEVHLTSTEYKLLRYLIENKGRIVTKAMLLEQLWDIDGNFVDENTIRVNIKRLRQKLNDDKQEYIATVFGMGYTFGE